MRLFGKLLFALTGLLFVGNVHGQDTLNQLDSNFFRDGFWRINLANNPIKSTNEIAFSEGQYDHGYKKGEWNTYINGKLRSKEWYQDTKIERYIKYDEGQKVVEMGELEPNGEIVNCHKAQYNSKGELISRTNIGRKGKILGGDYLDASYECWFTFRDSLGKYYTFPSRDCDSEKLKKDKPPVTCDPENLPITKPEKLPERLPQSPFLDGRAKPINEDGEYKDGKLWNGKKYKYDKNGLLEKIEIWKEGKYVGDATLDD